MPFSSRSVQKYLKVTWVTWGRYLKRSVRKRESCMIIKFFVSYSLVVISIFDPLQIANVEKTCTYSKNRCIIMIRKDSGLSTVWFFFLFKKHMNNMRQVHSCIDWMNVSVYALSQNNFTLFRSPSPSVSLSNFLWLQ